MITPLNLVHAKNKSQLSLNGLELWVLLLKGKTEKTWALGKGIYLSV